MVIARERLWPALAVASKALVRQTRAVDVDVWGAHCVAAVSLNVIETVLLLKSVGKLVPEMVRLSPPSKLMDPVGVRPETEHAIDEDARDALFGTTPRIEVSIGRCVPHVGSVARVHCKLVEVRVDVSSTHSDFANSIDLMSEEFVGKLVPVSDSLLVLSVKVKAVTSPTAAT